MAVNSAPTTTTTTPFLTRDDPNTNWADRGTWDLRKEGREIFANGDGFLCVRAGRDWTVRGDQTLRVSVEIDVASYGMAVAGCVLADGDAKDLPGLYMFGSYEESHGRGWYWARGRGLCVHGSFQEGEANDKLPEKERVSLELAYHGDKGRLSVLRDNGERLVVAEEVPPDCVPFFGCSSGTITVGEVEGPFSATVVKAARKMG
jgi:hypothetical protein